MLGVMRRERQRLADEQWRRVFERQRRSGLSIVAFCEREGIAKSTFFNKRRHLESEPREQNPSSAFVEVMPMGDDVAGEHLRDEVAVQEIGQRQPIELVLRGGVIVRVREGFDSSLLRRVVDAIGGAA